MAGDARKRTDDIDRKVKVALAKAIEKNGIEKTFKTLGIPEDIITTIKEKGEFLNEGADVNAKDNKGNTPLHKAAQKGHLEFIEFLVGKGADVNAKNDDGNTPLHRAAYYGQFQVIKFLTSQLKHKIWREPVNVSLYCLIEIKRLYVVHFCKVSIKNNFQSSNEKNGSFNSFMRNQ